MIHSETSNLGPKRFRASKIFGILSPFTDKIIQPESFGPKLSGRMVLDQIISGNLPLCMSWSEPTIDASLTLTVNVNMKLNEYVSEIKLELTLSAQILPFKITAGMFSQAPAIVPDFLCSGPNRQNIYFFSRILLKKVLIKFF